MTIKNQMAEGTHPTKRQKCDNEKDVDAGPSDLVKALAIKAFSTSPDLNMPKHHRSDSDDEPITPLKEKLSDSEITDDMRVPKREKKKKKSKDNKDNKDKTSVAERK